jgi:hypothetical protein
MARSGGRWRDVPKRFGNYHSVKRRYYRWIAMGVLDTMLAALAREVDVEWLMIDSTIVRAHQHDEMVGIVALVGDGGACGDAVDKIVHEGDVIALPGSTDQTNRIAEGIASGVDVGAQPAPRPAQALGIRPPFALRAPAATGSPKSAPRPSSHRNETARSNVPTM